MPRPQHRNVIGLLGVANGVEGDLRTGLPSQMIEVHEPARLLIEVEQTRVSVDAAREGLEDLRGWLDHPWVLLACFDPATLEIPWFDGRDWQLLDDSQMAPTPAAHRSLDIPNGRTCTIPVHLPIGARP